MENDKSLSKNCGGIEFFTINTKLSMLTSKNFTGGKVTSSGAQPDDLWFTYLFELSLNNIKLAILAIKLYIGVSLNGSEIQWIRRIQGIWQITEAWIGLNLKMLSVTCFAGTVVASLSPYPEIGDSSFRCALWTFKQQLTWKVRARCGISIVLL